MRIDKKKASALFALTLLIVSLLLVSMNGPSSATSPPAASGVSPAMIRLPPEDLELYPRFVKDLWDPTGYQWHELHPSKTNFYNLTSWERGWVLSPEDQIDMYAIDPPVKIYLENASVFDPMAPWGSMWHEVYPTFCQNWTLTSWEDTNYDGRVSPSDQIDMTELRTGAEVWFHVQDIYLVVPDTPWRMILDVKYWFQVDEVTVDMWLSPYPGPGTQIFVEYKCGYWTFDPTNPTCTKWNQIDPGMGPVRCLHLTSWGDNGDGKLSPSDIIDMTIMHPDPRAGTVEWYHVDFMSISLNLSPKKSPPVVPEPPVGPVYLESMISYDMFDLKNPVCTKWHEIYPSYSRMWHLSSWEDAPMLSPSDQILLRLKDEMIAEAWYHVDKLTVAMNLTSTYDGREHIVKFEGSLKQFKNYHWMYPVSTQWHEVNPLYSRQWHILWWWDEPPYDGLLGYCDYIYMIDKHTGWEEQFHVESLSTDMWVTKKVHDVAVIGVSSRLRWVFQGGIDPIDVNVTNKGDFNEPTVDVYAFYDGTQAAPKQTISLLIGETRTLTFNWNTAGVPPGPYTVSANATIPVDDVPGNNKLVGNVQVVIGPLPREADLEYYPRKVVDLGDPTWTQWHELHPSKANFYQIAMWEPGRVLSPEDQIDMYATDPPVKMNLTNISPFIPTKPLGTEWHEKSPTYCQIWNLTSWEDTNHDGMVSPSDQIDMTETVTRQVVWFHVQQLTQVGPEIWQLILDVKYWFQVDEVTVDMTLTPYPLPGPTIFVEYKCGYWTFNPRKPICTKWNQIDPMMGPIRCLHLTSWNDTNGDGKISPSDIIDMKPLYPNLGPAEYYHVDFISISLMLTPKPSPPVVPPPPVGPVYLESMVSYDMFDLKNPVCTKWHEIYPYYCRTWHLSSWEDMPMLSPSDQILLRLKDPITHEPIPGTETWYHVDKLTVAMNLTDEGGQTHIVKFEGSLDQFKKYHWTNPESTQWHEVNPEYCRQWHLSAWGDNGNRILDPGDIIGMNDKETGWYYLFYVNSLSTDIWVTQKICGVNITNVATFHCGSPESYGYPGGPGIPAWTIQVNVTVHNNGTIPLNCTVNAYYYNATTTVLIGTQNITNLAPCNTITLAFNWNLLGLSPCKTYTVKANATCLCGASDEYVDGMIKIKILGDVNSSNKVTWEDLGLIGLAYGSKKGDPNWNPHADFNDSGKVTWEDLGILGLYYGKSC